MAETAETSRQIFWIGTVRYAEGLWRMQIAHCTDSEDFRKTETGIQDWSTELSHTEISQEDV